MPTETEISHFRQEWINVFQEQNENLLANEIEDLDNLELVNDEDRFQELKNAATSLKAEEYLKTFREEIRELFGLKRDEFPIDKYKDLNKTDIARKMADYAVATYGIRPTDIGELQEETQLYQYNPATGTWEYFSKNKLGRLCKKMGDTEYTDHLEREFTRNLVNHGTFQRLENMGTNANELAIKEGKKLILEDIENKDITELETESIQRSDQALHSINADYEPGAECPRFQELVQQLLDNRPEQIDTLQEFLGWMLKFPDRTHKKALLILGVTNSGKSQLTEIVELMFEKERGKTVTNVSLPQIGFHRRFHINKLQNSIVNIDKDLSSGKIDDAANIKTVTAQEKMNIEPKGQDSYEIQPNAKFLIAANTSPEIENQDDEAYYGRFLTLKAPNTVPKEDRVKDLGKKIFEEEANGILN